MRSLIRLAAAGAVALPILIGAAGIASADVEYDHEGVAATADGAVQHVVMSGAEENGNSYWAEQWLAAGPDSAGTLTTVAWTWYGDAGYFQQYTYSGEEGAFAGETSALADDADYYYDDDYDDDDYDDYDDDDYDYDDDYDADDDYDVYDD